MTNSFIYGLVDPETQELRYVGKTRVGMKRALAEHSARCRNWIRKLKRRGLVQEVVVLEETDELDEAERRLISLFRRLGYSLTNIADGGEGGFKFDEDVRLRISQSKKGWNPSLETRSRMSAAKLGTVRTEEICEKIRNSMTGRKRPKEVCEKVGAALRGKRRTEEQRKRISERTSLAVKEWWAKRKAEQQNGIS